MPKHFGVTVSSVPIALTPGIAPSQLLAVSQQEKHPIFIFFQFLLLLKFFNMINLRHFKMYTIFILLFLKTYEMNKMEIFIKFFNLTYHHL